MSHNTLVEDAGSFSKLLAWANLKYSSISVSQNRFLGGEIVVILCLVRETQTFHVQISWGNAGLNETKQASFLQDFSRDFNIPMFCDSSSCYGRQCFSNLYNTSTVLNEDFAFFFFLQHPVKTCP